MNPSTAAAEAIADGLVRLGVSHAVLAPGSRSAPLAFALASAAGRGELRLHVRIDERSAGFLALGLARGGGDPVAVVTTSGTAVANLHPAVLEASHAGVPLVILSADRPHELRGTGANQTTDQVRIFGSSVRFFADVPAPHGRPDESADLASLLGRAFAAAIGARNAHPGPVHLNVAFREPLVPDDEPAASVSARHVPTRVHTAARVPDAMVMPPDRRTVVVAGDGAGSAATEFAEEGGYPLLAEPSSGARCGPNALGPYRLLLNSGRLAAQVQRVVAFGHSTLSREVGALLARRDIEVVVVAPHGDWPDAARNAAHVVGAVSAAGGEGDGRWLKTWLEADRLARAAVDEVLDIERVCGPLVAREVWASTTADQALVVGSSNPIRDLDLTAVPWRAPEEAPTVLANRGLAGIDGTISTASGVALASGRATRVFLGDLTFLHDVGGLLIGPGEERPSVQVVVVNDDGGGIFSLLEQGAPQHEAVFERVFGTPHGVRMAGLCEAYGLVHQPVSTLDELRAVLAEPLPGRSVVEVRVHRPGLRGLHARLRAAVGAALTA